MSLRVITRDEAEADIAEAALWYERRCGGLGKEFIRAVNSCFALIATQPQRFQSFIATRVWLCCEDFRIWSSIASSPTSSALSR